MTAVAVVLFRFSRRRILFSLLCKYLKLCFWRNFIRFRFLIHIITMSSLMFRLLLNDLVLISYLRRSSCRLLQIRCWRKVLVFWRSIRNYLWGCINNSFCVGFSLWVDRGFLSITGIKITISLWIIWLITHFIFCLLKYKVYCTDFFLTRNNDLW